MGSFPSANTSIPTSIPGTYEPNQAGIVGVSIPTSIPGIYVTPAGAIVIPAPSFIVGGAGASQTIALAGIQTGDLILAIIADNTANPASVAGWNAWLLAQQFVAGAFINVYARVVAPSDSSPFTMPSGTSVAAYAMAAFRLASAVDGTSTLKNGTSAAPASNSFTNTIAGDIAVNLIGWDVNSGNSDYTVSTGYTLAAHIHAIGGSKFGAAIEFLQLGAAGTVAASSGAALAQSGDWGVSSLAIYPVASYA